MKWAYGITTCEERLATTLPPTILSLAKAGFDHPRLFVDGAEVAFSRYKLQTTCHVPPLRTGSNWELALYELFCRFPTYDRFAIFQDDIYAVTNLRQYLEQSPWPVGGYLNLYTWPSNEPDALREIGQPAGPGFYESRLLASSAAKEQSGRGALALVFDQNGVLALRQSKLMAERPTAVEGHKRIDGKVCTAMNAAGFREYVHSPSLVQHRESNSAMGNRPHPRSKSFPGEEYDALQLL